MSDCDLLNSGDLIKSRWRITHKIGGGGFGQIYQAYDKLRREFVAVKVESNLQARQGIRMEVTVLRRIQNRQHVVELFSGGISTLYNYMVMTLLGSSLSELRRSLTEQCFTLSTVLRISLQILDAIETVHSIGFLHRDIKPSNFAVGRNNLRQIFILDFGLARKFTDYDQHVRPARAEAGFRGTIRYASINAHKNRELGRHDDLWSFFYMLIEFLIGSLPWSKIKDKESVGHLKETYDYTRFLTYLPDEFNRFLQHINELRYEDKPDYDFLRSIFTSSIQRLGYQENEPYDWEKTIEHEESDSLAKIESHKISSQTDEQKVKLDNKINIKETYLKSSPYDSVEKIKHYTTNRTLMNSFGQIDLVAKSTDDHPHLLLQQSCLVTPQEFDRLKLDSIGIGDQQHLLEKNTLPRSENRLPDKSIRHNIPLNTIDHNQTTNNGLLTYVSQQYSNAAAPGTPSAFSQWSPHNGETLTDDDLLKGNKSHSSRADERATTLSGERNSSFNTQPHHSSSRTFHPIKTNKQLPNDLHNEYCQSHRRFPSKHQRSHQQHISIPFGTYVKNTNHYHHHHHHRRRTPSPFPYSGK